MVSNDEKRQAERRRTRHFALWAVGGSLLLHGALWALSRGFDAPIFRRPTAIEVTLAPEPTETPRRVIAALPQPTPRHQTHQLPRELPRRARLSPRATTEPLTPRHPA